METEMKMLEDKVIKKRKTKATAGGKSLILPLHLFKESNADERGLSPEG